MARRMIARGLLAALVLQASLAAAEVSVSEAWVRATVPAQRTTGAFLKLRSTTDAKVIAVSSPAAKEVEMHRMSMKDGVMSMEAVATIALPAGKPVELKSGGLHLMLLDLVKPVQKGDTVPITLTVQGKDGKKSAVVVKAEVRALGDRR